MKKILLLSLIVFSLLSCNEPTGLLVEVYNPTDEVRINEMVELDYADVLHRLELTEDTSIIVLDVHGFQVYYQITFNNKLIFVPHPVGVGMTDYYRIIPGVPEHFDACAVGAHYDREGDIAWENGRIAFCVSGPEKDVEREQNCGYDVWVKRVDTPVIPQYYAGINGDTSYEEVCELMIEQFPNLKISGLTGELAWAATGEVIKTPAVYVVKNGAYEKVD